MINYTWITRTWMKITSFCILNIQIFPKCRHCTVPKILDYDTHTRMHLMHRHNLKVVSHSLTQMHATCLFFFSHFFLPVRAVYRVAWRFVEEEASAKKSEHFSASQSPLFSGLCVGPNTRLSQHLRRVQKSLDKFRESPTHSLTQYAGKVKKRCRRYQTRYLFIFCMLQISGKREKKNHFHSGALTHKHRLIRISNEFSTFFVPALLAKKKVV